MEKNTNVTLQKNQRPSYKRDQNKQEYGAWKSKIWYTIFML